MDSGSFLRYQSFQEDPISETMNISGNQQFANNKNNQDKEEHNDAMSSIMLQRGKDMYSIKKKPNTGSKLAFAHQVSGSTDM